MNEVIPTFRPRLPNADALVPWLRDIDSNRWYSNFGPLVRRFEAELARHYGVAGRRIVTIANATLGITLALVDATGGRPGLCLMPAWTHIASAAAAIGAGLTPWFVDVDADTWQLGPDAARDHLAAAPAPVRAVLPVAPFGAAIDAEAWAAFAADTGLPVVVDAAASFDTVRPSEGVVQIVSLHATKPFGIGEGGFILATDEARGERLRRMSNFGLDSHRLGILPGGNAKMSEYAAAVGLAALLTWPMDRQDFLDAARRLLGPLARLPGMSPAPGFDGTAAVSTANVLLARPTADRVITDLVERGIEARQWWGKGCHRHPTFADTPRTALPVTDDLAARVVGLPFFVGITGAEIDRVVAALKEASRPEA